MPAATISSWPPSCQRKKRAEPSTTAIATTSMFSVWNHSFASLESY